MLLGLGERGVAWRRRLRSADTPEEHALESYMGMRGIPLVSLEKDAVHYQYHVEKNIMLHAFMTRHLDKRFYHIPHFCYLLTFEEEHFLFTADVDYPTETFSNLDGKILRSVFLNPMFFHSVFDAAHFRGQLNFQSICVYHIPFETDDRMALRKMVFRDILSRPGNENKTIALSEPFQRIEFA